MNMRSLSPLAHTNICTCWPTLVFTIHTAIMCVGSTVYYNIICVMGSAGTIKLRGDVVKMIGHYASGQREVLQDLLQYADDHEMGGVAVARQEGIVIQLEEDDEDLSE